nr:elicitin-like protein [Pythium porphyrae]
MKVFALLALAAATVSAAPCGPVELGALGSLAGPAASCQAASGFTIIIADVLPTPAEVATICAAPECVELIKVAASTPLPSCTLPLKDGSSIGVDALFKEIAGKCESTTPTTAPTTTAPTTTTPGATTTAPETTEPTEPSASASGSKQEETPEPSAEAQEGSESGSTDMESPAVTAEAPSPEPSTTSAAVSVTVGAAVAVASSVAALAL